VRSSNDRFESRSFKKASVDQLLKEELHVCDLSFLDADGVEKMKLSSGNREKNILQPEWEFVRSSSMSGNLFEVPASVGISLSPGIKNWSSGVLSSQASGIAQSPQ